MHVLSFVKIRLPASVMIVGLFFIFCAFDNSFAESRYVDNKDGTVLDTMTDLVWIKNPDNAPGFINSMIWIKAKTCCNELVYGGYGPGVWYLPNIKELQTLVEDVNRSPRFDTTAFDGYPQPYWSSTDDTGSGTRAWVVNFSNGDLQSSPKLSLLNPVYLKARCVRKKQ